MRNFVPPVILSVPIAMAIFLTSMPREKPQLHHQSSVLEQVQNSETKVIESFSVQFTDYRELLSVIETRPLFSETRQLPSLESITEVENTIDNSTAKEEGKKNESDHLPPSIELIGFFGHSDKRRALIIQRDTREEMWISEGDKLGEWHIREVATSFLRLNFAGREHVVRLKR